MVFDEIMRLYNTLERDGKDGEMRKVFLTLNGGDGWTVSTKTQGTTHIKETHLNYTGMLENWDFIYLCSYCAFCVKKRFSVTHTSLSTRCVVCALI